MPRPVPPITPYPLPGYTTLIKYAEHRDLTPARISVIIKSGKLEGCYFRDEVNRFHIDQEKADVIMNEPSHFKEMAANRKRERKGESVPEHKHAETPLVDPKTGRYSDARTANEVLKYQMAKLNYEEKKGSLISANQVKEENYKMARTMREQLMSIPDRVAAKFAADRDERSIHIELTKEIRQALKKVETLLRQEFDK